MCRLFANNLAIMSVYCITKNGNMPFTTSQIQGKISKCLVLYKTQNNSIYNDNVNKQQLFIFAMLGLVNVSVSLKCYSKYLAVQFKKCLDTNM